MGIWFSSLLFQFPVHCMRYNVQNRNVNVEKPNSAVVSAECTYRDCCSRSCARSARTVHRVCVFRIIYIRVWPFFLAQYVRFLGIMRLCEKVRFFPSSDPTGLTRSHSTSSVKVHLHRRYRQRRKKRKIKTGWKMFHHGHDAAARSMFLHENIRYYNRTYKYVCAGKY